MNTIYLCAKRAYSLKNCLLFILCLLAQHALTQPIISSFSPASAPIGSPVVITGTNFSAVPANNTVYFGPVKAIVTMASTTSLTVTVPGGTGYMPVSITAGGLTAYSPNPFNVTFFSAGTINAVTFAPKVDYATIMSAALGDFNGDGKPDVVGVSPGGYFNSMLIFKNNSTAGHDSLTLAQEVDGIGTDLMATGDFDGDGKLEIVTSNHSANYITIFKNTGAAGSIAFTVQGPNYTTGLSPANIVVNDINGDGKPDILVCNSSSNSVSIFQNTTVAGGAITFAAKIDFLLGTSPQGIAVGDLNGDGKPEIISANQLQNNVSVLQNTSTGAALSFAAPVALLAGNGPSGVVIGDIDGDGKPDVAASNYYGSTISVIRNIGTPGAALTKNSFSIYIDYPTGANPTSISLADIDGDGKPDLVTCGVGANTASVLRNLSVTGAPVDPSSFVFHADFSVGNYPTNLTTGDIDGDGKPEVISGNYFGHSISILRNTIYGLPSTIAGTKTLCVNSAPPNITFTVSGGKAPYVFAYTINGGASQTVTAAGTSVTVAVPTGITGKFVYTLVTTTDNNQVVQHVSAATATVTVYAPGAAAAIKAPLCNASANGTITLTGNGGKSPYLYEAPGSSTYGASGAFTGFKQGSYIFSIKDASGCVGSDTVAVVAPAVLTDTVVTGALCFDSSIVFTAKGTGGTMPYLYSVNGHAGQSSPVLTMPSAPGNYNILLTDAHGCTADTVIGVNPPASALTATLTITGTTCFGTADGSIAVNPAGGYPGTYQYLMLPQPNYQNDRLFVGLKYGNYIFFMRDSGGCTVNITGLVTQPAPLSVTLVGTNQCFDSSSTLVAAGKGGTMPYAYSLNGAAKQSSDTFKHQPSPGNYTVWLTDAHSCAASATTQVTQPASALTGAIINTVNPTCYGSGNGSITAQGAGGFPPYQYKTVGYPIYQDSGRIVNLYNGGFTIIIKDSGGCTVNVNAIMNQPAQVTVTQKTGPLCLDSNTTLTAIAAGGTAPYRYGINSARFGTSNIFKNRPAAGIDTIRVLDANGCKGFNIFNIKPPASALTATLDVKNVSCSGFSDGTITVNASGGYASSYLYKLNGTPAFLPANKFVAQPAGAKTIFIKDSGGCIITKMVTLMQPVVLKVAVTAAPFCFGSKTSLTASGTGGTLPYQYALNTSSGSPYQPNPVFSNIVPGSYNMFEQDALGCVAGVSITIKAAIAALTAKATVTNATTGASNGQVAITAKGGVTPYRFKQGINAFQPGSIFTGLGPAIYIYTIKDANGCQIGLTATVGLTAGFTDAEPPAADGVTKVMPGNTELTLLALPNPSKTGFTLAVSGGDANVPAEIRVTDLYGRVMYHTTGTTNNNYKFGDDFIPGIYFAEVLNGNERKTIKLIKAD